MRSFFLFFATLIIRANLSAQAPSDTEEQVIHVKFKPLYSTTISNSNGMQRFGLKNLDLLNAANRVSASTRIFPYAGKYEQAHRAYELHLWYEIRIPTDKPINEVLTKYRGLGYFEQVEERKAFSISDTGIEDVPVLQEGTNDPMFPSQWHFQNTGQTGGVRGADISLVQAWEKETGHPSVIVAVLDGGIDYNHPDLRAAMWTNTGEIAGNNIDDDNNGYVDDIHGYGFGDNSSIIFPDMHATHVAGTIGAVTNNGIGVAGIAGGTGSGDGVRLMSCAGFGLGFNGGFEAAMVYAADNGAVISQNSWGGGSAAIEAAITYFIERAGYDNTNANFSQHIQTGPIAGGIVIFAAGNDNTNSTDAGYPASYQKVIAVAATDALDRKPGYSNYGSWIDISAPGSFVISTLPEAYGGYGSLSGTSMACPHVSGVAALIVSKYRGSSLSAAFVINRLLSSADRVPRLMTGLMGSGRLNANRALEETNNIPPGQINDLSSLRLTQNSVMLTWTAPGEDGQTGTASTYDIRLSPDPITEENFSAATPLPNVTAPKPSGSRETLLVTGLIQQKTFYFAMKTADYFFNTSTLSNVFSVLVPGPPSAQIPNQNITVSLYPGGQDMKTINVANSAVGGGDLTVTLTLDYAYSWMKVDPITYVIQGGASLDLPVYFIAGSSAATNLTGNVNVITNDPNINLARVPVSLTVLPGPDIAVDASHIDFGSQFLAHAKDSIIAITNKGVAALNISNITTDNPMFTVTVADTNIPAGASTNLTMSFTPTNVLAQTGSIMIESNDPDESTINILVGGQGIPAPAVSLSLSSIDINLNVGQKTSRQLTISNPGLSPLRWYGSIRAPLSYAAPPSGQALDLNQFVVMKESPEIITWQVTDPGTGLLYALGNSNKLYRYDPSTNSWSELSSCPSATVGVAAFHDGRIYAFKTAGGNGMHIYDVVTNTWQSRLIALNPATIGAAVSDGTFLYVASVATIYKYDYASNVWTLVTSASSFIYSIGGMAYDNGVIYCILVTGITADGTTPIKKYFISNDTWQYGTPLQTKANHALALDPVLKKIYCRNEQAKACVYDIAMDTWTTTEQAFADMIKPTYVNSQAGSGIYFVRAETTSFGRVNSPASSLWLSAEPIQGNLLESSSQEITLNISAENMIAGTYQGSLMIESIKNPHINATVPVKLTVAGIADISLSKTSIGPYTIYTGIPAFPTVSMINKGTDVLTLASVVSDNPAITATVPTMSLLPGQQVDIQVKIAPATAGNLNGIITFTSNDPDQPQLNLAVTASGILPPVADFAPNPISVTAFIGNVVEVPVRISNTGGSGLSMGTTSNQSWIGTPSVPLVLPGESVDTKLILDATDFAPGIYNGEFLCFYPGSTGDTMIPVTLEVTGTGPGVSLSSQILNFGEIYVGDTRTITPKVRNGGDQTLNITSITINGPGFDFQDTQHTLQPGEKFSLSVFFTPNTTGDFSGSLMITSNDPDNPVYVVPIKGRAVYRPIGGLSPTSFDVTLPANGHVTRYVRLTNTGGSNLNWFASVVYAGNSEQAGWIGLPMTSGFVGPGQTVDVALELSIGSVRAGNSFGTVYFWYGTNFMQVNVALTTTTPVVAQSILIEQPSAITSVVGHQSSGSWKIQNKGQQFLHWSLADVSSSLDMSKTSGALAAGAEEVISFILSPRTTVGNSSVAFKVKSSDPVKPSVDVSVPTITMKNYPPSIPGFPGSSQLTLGSQDLIVDLTGTSDLEGDPVSLAVLTAPFGQNVATVSIVSNKLVVKPTAVGQMIFRVVARDGFGGASTADMSVQVIQGSNSNVTTGLDLSKTGLEPEILISPNPTHNNATLFFNSPARGNLEISIHDTSGKIVWQHEEQTDGPEKREIAVNTSNLSPGLYVARFIINGKTIGALRVIKQ
jgi:subtilisin family serine protease